MTASSRVRVRNGDSKPTPTVPWPRLPSIAHMLRTVRILRYIMPLREGGSLPGLTEADDGFK